MRQRRVRPNRTQWWVVARRIDLFHQTGLRVRGSIRNLLLLSCSVPGPYRRYPNQNNRTFPPRSTEAAPVNGFAAQPAQPTMPPAHLAHHRKPGKTAPAHAETHRISGTFSPPPSKSYFAPFPPISRLKLAPHAASSPSHSQVESARPMPAQRALVPMPGSPLPPPDSSSTAELHSGIPCACSLPPRRRPPSK